MDYGQQLAVMYVETRRSDIKDKLVTQFFDLVCSRAHAYTNGHDFNDLVSAGLTALNTAADRYEPSKGKFITIATEFINGYIQHHRRNERSCIKNPTNIESDAFYFSKKMTSLGIDPSSHEIDLHDASRRLDVPVEKLEKGRRAYKVRARTVDFSSLQHDDEHDPLVGIDGLWASIDGSAWNGNSEREEIVLASRIMSYHAEGKTSAWIAKEVCIDQDIVKKCIEECSKISSLAEC